MNSKIDVGDVKNTENGYIPLPIVFVSRLSFVEADVLSSETVQFRALEFRLLPDQIYLNK